MVDDLTRKAAGYAVCGASCDRVIDLANRRVVVRTDPGDGRYRVVSTEESAAAPLPGIDGGVTLEAIIGVR